MLKFRTGESGEHQKLFVSSHCRLVAGRGERNEILLNDLEASRQQIALNARHGKLRQLDEILRQPVLKRELFAAVFSEADGPDNLGLTQQEIFGLFNLTVPPNAKKAA